MSASSGRENFNAGPSMDSSLATRSRHLLVVVHDFDGLIHSARQQRLSVQIGQGLDTSQAALNRASSLLGIINGVACLGELLLCLCENCAELGKLGLDRSKHLPYFGAALFQREGAKAHLQARQRREQGGGPGKRDAVIALQRFDEAR